MVEEYNEELDKQERFYFATILKGKISNGSGEELKGWWRVFEGLKMKKESGVDEGEEEEPWAMQCQCGREENMGGRKAPTLLQFLCFLGSLLLQMLAAFFILRILK